MQNSFRESVSSAHLDIPSGIRPLLGWSSSSKLASVIYLKSWQRLAGICRARHIRPYTLEASACSAPSVWGSSPRVSPCLRFSVVNCMLTPSPPFVPEEREKEEPTPAPWGSVGKRSRRNAVLFSPYFQRVSPTKGLHCDAGPLKCGREDSRGRRACRLSLMISPKHFNVAPLARNANPPRGLASFRTFYPYLGPPAVKPDKWVRFVRSEDQSALPTRFPGRQNWVRFASSKPLISKHLRKQLGSFRNSRKSVRFASLLHHPATARPALHFGREFVSSTPLPAPNPCLPANFPPLRASLLWKSLIG
jgi:hypothetical protein